jgi:hypothetical protein
MTKSVGIRGLGNNCALLHWRYALDAEHAHANSRTGSPARRPRSALGCHDKKSYAKRGPPERSAPLSAGGRLASF